MIRWMDMNQTSLRKYSAPAGAVLAIFIACLFVPKFATYSNILNVLRQSSYTAIPAVMMTAIIITGGINLSVGGVMSLAGVICALLINNGINAVLAFVIVAAMSVFFGILNGYFISEMNLPAFICTYTVGQIASGVALLLNNGKAVRVDNKAFLAFGNARIFGSIPLIIPIAAMFVVVAWFLMHKTTFGIKLFALGNNETLLRQVGINVTNVKVIAYSLSCLFAGLGGALLMARLGSGSPVQGKSYTLICIAASAIGGVNMAGGYGKILNTVFGSIVICIINNVLNLLQINNNVQEIILGAVIISLVSVSAYVKSRNEKLLLQY